MNSINTYIIGENHTKKYITKSTMQRVPASNRHYFIEGDNIHQMMKDYDISDITKITMLDIPLFSDFGFYIYAYGFICGKDYKDFIYNNTKTYIKKEHEIILPDIDSNASWKQDALKILYTFINDIMDTINVSSPDRATINLSLATCNSSLDSDTIVQNAIPITERYRDIYTSRVINNYNDLNRHKVENYIIIIGLNHVRNVERLLFNQIRYNIHIFD